MRLNDKILKTHHEGGAALIIGAELETKWNTDHKVVG